MCVALSLSAPSPLPPPSLSPSDDGHGWVSQSGSDQVKTLDTDESYELHVVAPRIQITAATVYGAIYALESLSQLLDAEAEAGLS